jgi:PAS domain S-box-containing protein
VPVTIDLQLVGAIGLCIAVTALAMFVMLHNPMARVNRRFGVMAFVTGGWILAISLALAANDQGTTVALGRIGFAFASAIPVTLIWMVDSLSDHRAWFRRMRLMVPGALCLVFVSLSLGPWIVSGANPGSPRSNFIYGPAHRWFGVYFLLLFLTGIYTLWRTSSNASGTTRIQLRYLLLGISLTGAGAIATNLIVPVVWKTSRYSFLGPYFSLLFFSFSAHAIIRHRLMDIRIFIRKGVVYVSAIICSGIVFAVIAQPIARAAGYQHGDYVHPGTALVIALLLAVAFQPLKAWLQLYMNRYVYRESYDYQRTVREVTKRLSTMLDLQSLLTYLTATITHTLKVETVFIYTWDPSRRAFIPWLSNDARGAPNQPAPSVLADTSHLLTFLRMEQRCLVREEAHIEAATALVKTAAEDLTALGVEVALPLIKESTVTGIVLVGPKRSGDPYFSEDIDLLTLLTSQAAVAMENAQLYRQVVLANEYLDNILSTMESGVIAVDATGQVTRVNPAAERLTGLSSDLIQSRRRLPAMLALPLRATLEDRKARPQFETSIDGPAGVIPLVCSTATLQSKDGAPEGALIVFSDLTHVKDLERQKHAAERLASFGSLASGVAHEIKNPLVAIRTFAELLPERFADSDFREDFSKVVVREIDRIDNLVARLRGIASAPQQHLQSVDVRQPMSETLKLLRGQLEQTHTTVHTAADDDTSYFVTIDDSSLKQLFLNLFQNAIEAMGPDGNLVIRLARRHAGGSDWVTIEISDSGPGIADSVRDRIFEPFFTTKATGSGLGLAICRSIVDAHRGSIRAQNNAGRPGATIIVDLPATDSAARSLHASAIRG